MDLTVIGAGFGRTGTSTLRAALELLGVREVYHMYEVLRHPEHTVLWCGGPEPKWNDVLRGYKAAVDWPAAYFYDTLARLNPKAKVILTLRDANEWYDSAHATIWRRRNERWARGLRGSVGDEIVWDRTFGGRFEDRQHAIGIYNRHIEEVRDTIPKERLLEWDVNEGWPRLCAFLGVAIPDVEFPHINKRALFASRIEKFDNDPKTPFLE